VSLTLTSDDLESDIIVNDSLTLTNTTIWFVAALSLIVDVRTDVRTFLPGLLGHLGGDDLKKENEVALQRAEMRKVRWMCSVKIQDRVPSKGFRERL